MDKITLKIGMLFFAGVFLASCATTPQIRLKSDEFGMRLNRSTYIAKSVAYSADGKYLAIGTDNGILNLYDMIEGRILWSIAKPHHGEAVSDASSLWKVYLSEEVRAVAFTPDARYVVSGGNASVKLWDVMSGVCVRTFPAPQSFVTSVVVTPDGTRILAGGVLGLDGFVKLWDIASGKLLREFSGHKWIAFVGPAHVFSVDVSPDGARVLSSDGQGNIKLWDIETGHEVRTFDTPRSRWVIPVVFYVAFMPDGKRFVSTSIEKVGTPITRLWDLETGRTAQTFSGLMLNRGAITPDGKHLLTGEVFSGIMRMWDVETGNEIRTLPGISVTGKDIFVRKLYEVDTGAFSADGKRLVTWSPDASVRLWDVKSGEEMAVMTTFDDNEWLTITTNGYYHASVNGHRYLNVLLGNRVYTAEQFYDVFYRPDIVAAKLRG